MTFYQDDATCHGEESQSLLEVSQQPELKPRGSDWRPPAIILGEPSCIKHVFAPLNSQPSSLKTMGQLTTNSYSRIYGISLFTFFSMALR